MVVLGGVAVSYERGTPVSEVFVLESICINRSLQGYLAQKTQHPPPQGATIGIVLL